MKRWMRNLALLATLVAVGVYVWLNWAKLTGHIHSFDARYVPAMLVVPLASILVNGWIARDLVLEFGVKLRPVEWYGLTTISSMGNYLLPQAGAVSRGVYLKQVHHLPWGAYTATVLVTYLFFLAVSGLVGLAGLAAMAWRDGTLAPWPFWAAFAALLATGLVFTPAASLLRPFRRLGPFFGHLDEGLTHLRRGGILAKMGLLQLALIALNTTGIWLAYLSIHQPISWLGSLMQTLLAMASGIVNVTPGNVGIAEAAAGFTAYGLHADANLAVVAYSIFRLAAIATVFLLGPLFTVLLGRYRSPVEPPAPGAVAGDAPPAVPDASVPKITR